MKVYLLSQVSILLSGVSVLYTPSEQVYSFDTILQLFLRCNISIIFQHCPVLVLPIQDVSPNLILVHHTHTTMAQETFEKWQCHECGTAPHIYPTTTRCTGVRSDGRLCQHDVCKLCPKDGDIPPLGTTRRQLRAIPPSTSFPPLPTFNTQRPLTRFHHSVSSRPGRPSVRGWWKCCSCEHDNNPVLADKRCSCCGHTRGSHCSTYR